MMLPTDSRCWLAAAVLGLLAAGPGELRAQSINPSFTPSEPIPGEAFVEEAPAEEAPAEEAGIADFGEEAAGEAGAGVIAEPSARGSSAQDDGFSLWEAFSQFFDLGVPRPASRRERYRLAISAGAGYDDNVFTTQTDQIGSLTNNLNGSFTFASGNDRLNVDTTLAGGAVYYYDRPGDKSDLNGSWSGNVSYYFNRRLRVTGNFSLSYLSQPDPTLVGGVTRFNGDYYALSGGVSVSYSLRPRLSARVEWRASTIQYVEEDQNQQLGFTQQTYVLALDYVLHPRTTLILEYRYSPLSYEAADQDSIGHILSAGFNTRFSPRLLWTLQVGAEARQLNNTTEDAKSEYVGPFVESNVTYELAPESSLSGNLRYGTEPSGVAGISIRETFRTGLNFRYTFAGRLGTDLGLFYQHDRYDQPGDQNDFSQGYFVGSIGLSYRINPAFALTGRYEYSTVNSEAANSDYTRNVTTLGIEIVF